MEFPYPQKILVVTHFDSVIDGYRDPRHTTYPFVDNVAERIRSPYREGMGPWNSVLYSRTMQLGGGVNEEGRPRFKIDHAFNLDRIISTTFNADGSVSIDQDTYRTSEGREFIIIQDKDIKDGRPDKHYAIRAHDKYPSVRDVLSKRKIKEEELAEAGGFKIYQCLTPEEIISSDGWLELSVRTNNASPEELMEGSTILAYYIMLAKKNGCFQSGWNREGSPFHGAMRFAVSYTSLDYRVFPWVLGAISQRSEAFGWYGFNSHGCFLRESAQSPTRVVGVEEAFSVISTNLDKAIQELKKNVDLTPLLLRIIADATTQSHQQQ